MSRIFGLSQKGGKEIDSNSFSASNPDDEFGEISYVDWMKNRDWHILSGWFSENEMVFSNTAPDDASFDCFNFSESHILSHTCKYLPGQEYKKFTQASWRCEGDVLSLSVAGTISVDVVTKNEKNESETKSKVKRKFMYDLDYIVTEITDRRFQIKKKNVLVSKEINSS
eukprot:gene10038-2357_t